MGFKVGIGSNGQNLKNGLQIQILKIKKNLNCLSHSLQLSCCLAVLLEQQPFSQSSPRPPLLITRNRKSFFKKPNLNEKFHCFIKGFESNLMPLELLHGCRCMEKTIHTFIVFNSLRQTVSSSFFSRPEKQKHKYCII